MTNRERKAEALKRERVITVGKQSDNETVAALYRKKLTGLPLTRVRRELRDVYREAEQADRMLLAYSMESEGKLPLLSSEQAPLVLAIGNKAYYIASEMSRRGVPILSDAPLGGTYFQKFFLEVSDQCERGAKETTGNKFLRKFTSKVRKLLKRN